MKTVTRYEADDGSLWNTIEEAERRDRLIFDVRVTMCHLIPNEPYKDQLDEGRCYIQQSLPLLVLVRRTLYDICNQPGILKYLFDDQKKRFNKTDDILVQTHPSWIHRFLDGGHPPLSKAYYRLCCIDNQGREWQQPYYAEHPNPSANCCASYS